MDTIPVICHSFDGKHSTEQWPRNPEEIATLAKFRMVVIEKFEGTCVISRAAAAGPTYLWMCL